MSDHTDPVEDERVFRELFDLFIDQTQGSLVPPPLPTGNAGAAATAGMSPLRHSDDLCIGIFSTDITNNAPPSPPPSEPDLDQAFNNLAAQMEVDDADAGAADLIYHGFYTALANSTFFFFLLSFGRYLIALLFSGLGCPITMPNNWKRILYHAYTGFYSATVLQVPRVHRNTLIAKAVSLAKERCKKSNILWAAEEDRTYPTSITSITLTRNVRLILSSPETISIDGVDVRTSMSEDRFRNKFYSMVS